MNEKIFNLRTIIQLLAGLPFHTRLEPLALVVEHVLGIPAASISWLMIVPLFPIMNDIIITQNPALLSAVMYCKTHHIDLDDPVAVELAYDEARRLWGLDHVRLIPMKDMQPAMNTRIVWQ